MIEETYSGDRTSSALVILADGMSATELRALIGLVPDRSWEQGEPVGKTGRGRRPYAGWQIDAGQNDQTPESQVAALLTRVAEVSGRIRGATADPRIRSVALWIWSQDPEFAFHLPADLAMGIARLGAELKIKVYDVGDGR